MLKQSLFLHRHAHAHPRDVIPIHLGGASSPILILPSTTRTKNRSKSAAGILRVSGVRAALTSAEKSTAVKAVVTVLRTVGGALTHLGLTRGLDDIGDLLGKTLLLEMVSADLDSATGKEKSTIKSYAKSSGKKGDEVYYESSLVVPQDFGEVGAILVENEHHNDMFVDSIIVKGLPAGDVQFTCNSWVHSKFDNPEKRVFFANKSYLPTKTPNGLRRLRESELKTLRGDGKGERKKFDRIYDYDLYNDLGDPDSGDDFVRPILGGPQNPYPRRCRTGRPKTKKDPLSESRSSFVYVPRDESFSEVKQATFSVKTVYSLLHALVPSLESFFVDNTEGFPHFNAIDTLFVEGIDLPTANKSLVDVIPRIFKAITEAETKILRFETPRMIDRDSFSWIKDSEFARQTLAGANACCIQLVTEWPIKSKLDPLVYGPAESAITDELVQYQIGGVTSVDEAVKQKKLFLLDYHDFLLPFVNDVRSLKGTTLYGSRTLFFLMPDGALRPIAIELTRPPINGNPVWRQVFQPSWDATGIWLWRLARSHVLAHDSGYHQLVSHWLRTHCCTEPYIIAANRQLSAMHPIHRLLKPHFRYTMEINALAREALINNNGIIEKGFTPGKYSILLSSVAYAQQWRFDLQALPADLIHRGVAVEDPSAPHGLKLTIEDYPYASDGLLLWDAIKQWVTDYVTYYYPDSATVESDGELQAWWFEVRTVGHGDKKDEPWWPDSKTFDGLIHILTTIIWVASGHHAAVNFGQFDFAGYFPNRPTIARTPMPTEEASEAVFRRFLEKPEDFLLESFPSQVQATVVMSILDVLSSHSPDEEYIGEKMEPYYAENGTVKGAFEQFQGRLKEIEGIIDARNANLELKNRTGAGVVPYELLKPYSEPGVTAKGVPSSISI
ncbi:lipoxygenase [Genlisea aurea]|uniref:Lipoxygenase n=1 Tax=Genlisea aurea TaxID=192259 RepID=S8CRL2_9LAMI|nr:lipoxygenase [Genlisea aurea]